MSSYNMLSLKLLPLFVATPLLINSLIVFAAHDAIAQNTLPPLKISTPPVPLQLNRLLPISSNQIKVLLLILLRQVVLLITLQRKFNLKGILEVSTAPAIALMGS